MNFITMENDNITASVAERCDDTLKEKKKPDVTETSSLW